MSTPQFSVGTWVFWHVQKNGVQVTRVGRIHQVFDPDKTSISIGDIEDSDKFLHDTRGAGQDVLVDGMHRYVVAIPDATGHQMHLAIPDPRKLLVLHRPPGSTKPIEIVPSQPVQLVSRGSGQSTELKVDGKRIPCIKSIKIEITPEEMIKMDVQSMGPNLNLIGRILTVEEYDPAGDTE